MIEKTINFSWKNRFLIISMTILLLLASLWAIKKTPLDALPDLTPPQIIVSVKWQGQSPQLIEDQIIYPLTNALMSVSGAKTVRAFSSFENALVYVIFEEGHDIYFSRDRVAEKINELLPTFPKTAQVKMGPDATGIGWVYEYALTSKTKDLAELYDLQQYYYKYALLGINGVSEVATVGGFEKNYQITINEGKLVEQELTIQDVIKAIKSNNEDRGGRIILENGYEQIIQATGYAKSAEDLGNIVIKNREGNPLRVLDVASVDIVPSYRRGMADLNGQGEVVGGIVIVRYKENAYAVIQEIKAKLEAIKLDDVALVTTYDRSDLITKAIDTLTHTLKEESVVVLVIILMFLLHFRSALIIIITLPLTIAITFLWMKWTGVESNIMSLGGIAIAIGAMIDASIVMVENVHKKIQAHKGVLEGEERIQLILDASKQVGRPIFFALMLIVVSFLPIFALSGQEGALFKPLAYTKTFAMITGAIVSITLVPILMVYLIRGEILDERRNWINRFFIWLYSPLLRGALYLRYLVPLVLVGFVAYGVIIYNKQKWEFMPPLNEQTYMYMPVTPYGIGINMAKELTQKTDKILKENFPEVATVFGKAGRADTATDPAPLSMIETIITFKPQSEWREGMTYEKLLNEMESTLQIRGLTNSWTYPIRGRIDMLLSGIRTPLGIKLYGDTSEELAIYAQKIEQRLKAYGGTQSVFADKANSGYYLNINLNDAKIAEYGITKNLILDTISNGVGGMKVATLYDGIKRYPISVRYEQHNRADVTSMGDIRIKTPYGYAPLKTFAHLYYKEAPSILKAEKGKKVIFIYITPNQGTTSQAYKKEGAKLLADLKLPTGYYFEWAGESEYLESAMERLLFIVPITLFVTFILIYMGLGSMRNALIVFLTLPFATVGGILYVNMLNFNFSIAVIVGFLSLIGVATETAIVMIIYLEEAVKRVKVRTTENLKEAIYEGAVLRVRPKLMTVFAILGGLIPIMYIDGVGSEVMQRIASPMIGGVVSSAVLTLFIIPVVYFMSLKRD
ncbi:MAG: CusA/CzcA family heavy metal efflux RND transporter [Sulfurovum sp.]|nr:MAG: CusA/CzcA family heavy metal efflux RND transporter [Sulfurovum sp.]